MKFKKYVGVTLIGILTVAMVGCSTPKSENVEGASATKIEEGKETSTTEKSTNVEGSTKEEIVLVDDDIAKIVLTEKVNDEIFGPTYNFLIENKSDAKIIVQSRDTSIDGVMQEPIFSVEVMPDKKATGEMTFMDIETLDDLKNLEGKLVVLNENYSEVASYELVID